VSVPDRDWCCQHVKIGDFGLCVIGGRLGNDAMAGVTVGTDPYMSPEMTSKPEQIDTDEKKQKCDVYSFGILLLTMATRKEQWQEQLRKRGGVNEVRTWVEEAKDVSKGKRRAGSMHAKKGRPPIPLWIDDQYTALIESCWHQEPAERPMFKDIATDLGSVSSMVVLAREDFSGLLWDMEAFYRINKKEVQMPDTEAGHKKGVEVFRKHGLDTFEALHDLVHRASDERHRESLAASPRRLSPGGGGSSGAGGLVAEGVPPPSAGAGAGAIAELDQLIGSINQVIEIGSIKGGRGRPLERMEKWLDH
jgi:serine/threonine protein kinase